jgi:hypothetical protein
MRIRTVALYAAVLLIWMLGSVAHAADDPFTGTWDLDLQASQGGARSQVLTIEVVENRESYRSELMLPDGTRQVTHYSAAYNEREYPSETTITQPNGTTIRHKDSVILKKIALQTRERQWKRDGRVIRILRRNLSSDGRTLISRVIDVDASGREHVVGSLVFNRR